MRIGIDTGGTFTDFVWLDAHGRWQIHKQLSTPHNPAAAILDGISSLAVSPETAVVHGSTVATNALLERRGARTALITTQGFADVLAIGRQNRPDIYALVPQKPAPLVPKQWRFEVTERVTAVGEILRPLQTDNLTPILNQIQADNIESVAICLLFSFLRPEHEQQIGQMLAAALPHLQLSLSSDILPEYREYERTSTTVINAYVAPLMSRYLQQLEAGLAGRPLTIMQSNGGIISAKTAGAEAARTALSGPAGGVVGAYTVSAKAGFHQIITFDMGGTSTDVALCPGKLPTTTRGTIADLPLRLPIIDIHTVGAGGGSLAMIDAGGALNVGPQSAGADPGPACYGQELTERGLQIGAWSQATVTDANLVLGRLDADHFLGGTMPLDGAAAQKAIQEIAHLMEVDSVETAAWGIIQVANANMERAIRKISVERGYDPRRFTLVPFGGAGPLHACELAQNLHIPQVLMPPTPGVLSALGMLVAKPTKDYSQTVMYEVAKGNTASAQWLSAQFKPLAGKALADMQAEGHNGRSLVFEYSLDMRYKGQAHELNIVIDLNKLQAPISTLFHEAHHARYGYQQPEEALEIVTIRLTAVAPHTPPPLPQHPTAQHDLQTAVIGKKTVWFQQAPHPTTLYDRTQLGTGHQFPGPAIVTQYDTTIVIPPGWLTAVDSFHNLIVTQNK